MDVLLLDGLFLLVDIISMSLFAVNITHCNVKVIFILYIMSGDMSPFCSKL